MTLLKDPIIGTHGDDIDVNGYGHEFSWNNSLLIAKYLQRRHSFKSFLSTCLEWKMLEILHSTCTRCLSNKFGVKWPNWGEPQQGNNLKIKPQFWHFLTIRMTCKVLLESQIRKAIQIDKHVPIELRGSTINTAYLTWYERRRRKNRFSFENWIGVFFVA